MAVALAAGMASPPLVVVAVHVRRGLVLGAEEERLPLSVVFIVVLKRLHVGGRTTSHAVHFAVSSFYNDIINKFIHTF